jgi:PEP-CTERM motif
MKRLLLGLVVAVLCTVSTASGVGFFVDTAPNVYGSPDWAPWLAQAKVDVADGSFINMRSSNFTAAGSNWLDPYDEIVYSTGDLGRRLHWLYYLPGETVANLAGRFEVKWVIDWGGGDWTYEGGGWAADGAEVGWVEPGSWEDYDGGVFGSLGFAWWATDNEADPMDSFGTIYDETDQDDVDALRQQVFSYQTFARGEYRYMESGCTEWTYGEIQLDVVPEPGSIVLLSIGLLGAAGVAYRRRRNG